MTKPKWMSKHPCEACSAGYGDCAQGWVMSMMCCKNCTHLKQNPSYTPEDYAEMGVKVEPPVEPSEPTCYEGMWGSLDQVGRRRAF